MIHAAEDLLLWVGMHSSTFWPPSRLVLGDEQQINIRQSYLYLGLLGVMVTLVASLMSSKRAQSASLEHIPKFKTSKWRWWFGAEDLLKQSYNMFHNLPYQINTPDGVQVALPVKYISEAKMMPDTTLNSEFAINEQLQTKYTGFPIANEKREKMIALLRIKISPSIVANLVPQLKSELEYFMSTDFPSCENWTAVSWKLFGLRTIARLSGSVFVGTAISRQEEWTQTTIDFAMYVFIAAAKLSTVPSWARPLLRPFVSELGKIKVAMGLASQTLAPLLAEKARQRFEEDGCMEMEENETCLDSLIDALDEEERWDSKVQAELQLLLSAASIHTIGHVLCECLCELATLADFQEELRREAVDVSHSDMKLGSRGWADGLKKMDSFMKEVQRFHGNMAAFFRKVMKPVTFTDGTYLPAGSSIFLPQAAVSLDDEHYADAQTFDPLRFYKLRDENNGRWQFTASDDCNIHFGIGKHTCPGRYLASVQIKIVLAYFLLNFDIRLKPGTKRPEPFTLTMTKAPRDDVELEFRRRP